MSLESGKTKIPEKEALIDLGGLADLETRHPKRSTSHLFETP